MRSLFVSDLDGTLLNDDQYIPEHTARTINNLIEKGMNFTIATARSYTSAEPILRPLHLRLPVVLHNGVFVYDTMKRQNIASWLIGSEPEEMNSILDVFDRHGAPVMVFTSNDGGEGNCRIYYTGIHNPGEAHYIEGRQKSGDKRLTLVQDLSGLGGKEIISLVAMGDFEELDPVYQELKANFDLTYHFSRDIYSGAHWLEITHRFGNKQHAVSFLKDYLKAEQLICFGDHLNDCGMFDVADYKYAVKNAHAELRVKATEIIGSNMDNGVAAFLEQNYDGF